MKIKLMETAAMLYTNVVSDENRGMGDSKDAQFVYDEYCQKNGLDKRAVELYSQVGFYYQKFLPVAIHEAELKVMKEYTAKLAKYYDDKGDTAKATTLMEIAAQLEV